MDRKQKERQIKDNMERAIERANRQWSHNNRREVTPEVKEFHRKEFEKAARRVDRGKLHDVWNDK